VIARLSGRRRHGHGLAVVRRVASEHRGRFVLHRGDLGTVATLELPLDAANAADGAA
jgi:signal transduction histidine kinase